MSLGLVKMKIEDEAKKHMESSVKDPASAIDFLVDGNLKSKDEDMSFELLSAIAMQLSQQSRSPKVASDAFKALAYVILDLHQKHIMADITDTISKAVSTATKRIQDELVEATDELVLVATKSTEAGRQLITECNETISKFKGAMEDVALKIMEEKTMEKGEQVAVIRKEGEVLGYHM